MNLVKMAMVAQQIICATPWPMTLWRLAGKGMRATTKAIVLLWPMNRWARALAWVVLEPMPVEPVVLELRMPAAAPAALKPERPVRQMAAKAGQRRRVGKPAVQPVRRALGRAVEHARRALHEAPREAGLLGGVELHFL